MNDTVESNTSIETIKPSVSVTYKNNIERDKINENLKTWNIGVFGYTGLGLASMIAILKNRKKRK